MFYARYDLGQIIFTMLVLVLCKFLYLWHCKRVKLYWSRKATVRVDWTCKNGK